MLKGSVSKAWGAPEGGVCLLRFAFNGQEKVDEISGLGNHNTALFWEYDTRLGRRWNVDPVVKPFESSYATFSDNPIFNIDPNGDIAGDYYRDGNWVGNDGIDDGKVYHAANDGDITFGLGVLKYSKFKEWNHDIEDPKLKEYMPTLLEHEGKYVNHKNDPGGATNRGITFNTFKKYSEKILGVKPTLENLKRLTDSQASAIYEVGYWNPSKASNISDKQLGWQYFDTYVNGGASSVLKSTLINYGVTTSNQIKELNTLLKTTNAEELYGNFRGERICRYELLIENNSKLASFKKGWMVRANRFQYIQE